MKLAQTGQQESLSLNFRHFQHRNRFRSEHRQMKIFRLVKINVYFCTSHVNRSNVDSILSVIAEFRLNVSISSDIAHSASLSRSLVHAQCNAVILKYSNFHHSIFLQSESIRCDAIAASSNIWILWLECEPDTCEYKFIASMYVLLRGDIKLLRISNATVVHFISHTAHLLQIHSSFRRLIQNIETHHWELAKGMFSLSRDPQHGFAHTHHF